MLLKLKHAYRSPRYLAEMWILFERGLTWEEDSASLITPELMLMLLVPEQL